MLFNKNDSNIVFDKSMKSAKGLINGWLKQEKIKFKNLYLILSKLDFYHDGKIYIINSEEKVNGFYYSIDGKNYSVYDDILLLNSRRICVRTFGKEVLYEYIEDPLSVDGFRMIKIKTRSHFRTFGPSYDYKILLEAQPEYNSLLVYDKNISIHLCLFYDDNLSRIEATELDNYPELKKYLVNLKFPCSILDVYSKICEISLSKNYNLRSFTLFFARKMSDGKKRETDRICIKQGKLCEFKMTTLDGNVITMDQDGKFSYMSKGNSVTFSINELENNEVTYSLSSDADRKIVDYMNGEMASSVHNARCQLADTKRKIRTIFNKPKR